MDQVHKPVVVVHRAVGHLTQLACQHCRVDRGDLPAHHGRFHLPVPAHVKCHLDHVVDPLWHLNPAVHADHHILHRFLDLLPRSPSELPAVNNLTVPFVRHVPLIPVLGDPGAQPFAVVHDADLGPQVKQVTVGIWRTCENKQLLDLAADRLQCLPSFAGPVLETPVLVDHHACERPRLPAFLDQIHQPRKVLPVDHVDVRVHHQCL